MQDAQAAHPPPATATAPMSVWVYASGGEVALLLNGKEVARKTMTPGDKFKAEFKLPYQPGSLTAVAYANGKEIARKTLQTVGAPAKLRLRAERKNIAGSPADLAYVVGDAAFIGDPVQFAPDGLGNADGHGLAHWVLIHRQSTLKLTSSRQCATQIADCDSD